MPRRKNPDEITAKQAQIIKYKVEGTLNNKPQREWAQKVYPKAAPLSAQIEVSKNLNKPHVKAALEVALAKHGLTVDSVVGVVAEGMAATKTVIIGNGEQAMADEVADHGIRLRAAGMAAGWMGLNNNETAVNINFNSYARDQRDKYGLS